MKKTMFHEHVSKWIDSSQSDIHLEWVRRFVNNHFYDKVTKEALNGQIDLKITQITASALDHSRYDFE